MELKVGKWYFFYAQEQGDAVLLMRLPNLPNKTSDAERYASAVSLCTTVLSGLPDLEGLEYIGEL